MNDQIARALIDLIVSIEMSDEESVSVEASASFIEDATATLGNLSETERTELVAVINQMESETAMEDRREILRDLPEGLGILD